MSRILLTGIFLVLTLALNGQSKSLVPIEDLQKHWLTVDRSNEQYIPYVIGSSLNYPVIGLLLNTNTNAGLVLECCVPAGTAVFINNQIVNRTEFQTCQYLDVDSLSKLYAKEELFISFYGDSFNPQELSTKLLGKQPINLLSEVSDNTAQVKKRPLDNFANFYLTAILLILGFYAFIVNRHPKVYKDFFNFSKAFSPTLKEEKILAQGNVGTANALFLWGHSMVISLVIILFWKVLGGIPDMFDFVDFQSFKRATFSWLVLAALVYLTIGLKYLLIRVLCSMLNFDKIAQIHFFDFIRLSMIFASFTLMVLTAIYFSRLDYQLVPYTIALYTFIALLVARIVVLLLKLIAGSTFRKIHLISYLCTTEILPLIIGIRIFF